jgi:hypothetical protein
VIEINKGVRRPETLLQFFTGDHFSWTLKQNLQNLQRLLLQLYLHALLSQFSRVGINLEGAESNGP